MNASSPAVGALRVVRLQSPQRAILFSLSLLLCTPLLIAGGPRHGAGTTYFNPGVVGQPIHWSTGQVTYFVDQGPQSATVTNEDVSGQNVVPGSQSLAQPFDVAPAALAYPVGVVFDADGAVLDDIFGSYRHLAQRDHRHRPARGQRRLRIGGCRGRRSPGLLRRGDHPWRRELRCRDGHAHFAGGVPPALSALPPSLSVAARVSVNWTVQPWCCTSGALHERPYGFIEAGRGSRGVRQRDGGHLSGRSDREGLAGGATRRRTACFFLRMPEWDNPVSFSAHGCSPRICLGWRQLPAQSEHWPERSAGTDRTPGQGRARESHGWRDRDLLPGGIWAPPCAQKGRCAQAQLLVSQSSTAIFGLDGTVSFTPAAIAGVRDERG